MSSTKTFDELPEEVKEQFDKFDFHKLSIELMQEQEKKHGEVLQELTAHVLMGLFFHAAVKLGISQRLSSETIHEGLRCIEADIDKRYPGIRKEFDEEFGHQGEPLQ